MNLKLALGSKKPEKFIHSWSYQAETECYVCNCGCDSEIALGTLAKVYRLVKFNPNKIAGKYLDFLVLRG